MDIIRVHNLYKVIDLESYKLEILKDINIDIKENEYIAIMGPSGSGKSTLLGILSCIDRYCAGKVVIDGTDVSKLKNDELTEFRNENIGIVFQNFNLIPVLNVEENVEVPLFFTRKEINSQKKVSELLEVVGLEHKRKVFINQLSGGEQQRVAIARALAGEPKILLADEPTGALDSKNSKMVLDIFEEFRKKYNMTIIMITHDDKVARRADRILYIKDGMLQQGEFEK